MALLLDIDPVGSSGVVAVSTASLLPSTSTSATLRPRCSGGRINVFKSAMAGTCKGHEELAASAIPLEAVPPWSLRVAGADRARTVEPLGYAVDAAASGLDPCTPDFGSRHVSLRLTGEVRLADLWTT